MFYINMLWMEGFEPSNSEIKSHDICSTIFSLSNLKREKYHYRKNINNYIYKFEHMKNLKTNYKFNIFHILIKSDTTITNKLNIDEEILLARHPSSLSVVQIMNSNYHHTQ